MNRNWMEPEEDELPIIYNIRKSIWNHYKETNLKINADLHGHSRRFNSFIYGCDIGRNIMARIFPLIM